MDVLHMCLFVGLVYLLNSPRIDAKSTHDAEGGACEATGGAGGVCVPLPLCPAVAHAIARGARQHTRCGFVGSVEVVCCVTEAHAVGSTSSPFNIQTSTLPRQPDREVESSTVRTYVPFPYVESEAKPTVISAVPVFVETVSPSPAVDFFENNIDSNEEIDDADDSDNNGSIVEEIRERIFLGKRRRNRVSPTLFAINTLKGFVDAILGKPTVPPISEVATPAPKPLKPLLPLYTFRPQTEHNSPPSTPIYSMNSNSDFTWKPKNFFPTTNILLPPTTQMSHLDVLPNENTLLHSKPSSTLGYQNPSSMWQNMFSTFPPTRPYDLKPENPFVLRPSQMPTAEAPTSTTPVPGFPWELKPSLDGATTRAPDDHSWVDSVLNSSPAPIPPSTERTAVAETLLPAQPQLEPSPSTNSPVDKGERPESGITSLPQLEPSSENGTTVGSKSQEACAQYRKIPQLTRYIVGGDLAAQGEFPHMVALGFPRPGQTELSWLCGGTLLSEEYVLTAAHCVETRYGRPLAARVGFTNLTADWATGAEVALRDALVFPGYAPAARAHDIALLRLAAPLRFSQWVQPACLRADPAPPRAQLIATGWGSITPDGANPTDHMKKALVTPVDDASCRSTYPRVFRQEMLCAGSVDVVDTCKGDSGGPLQLLEDAASHIYTVVGVTSFGPNPCAGARPGVYTRVASYLPWIESVVWRHPLGRDPRA